MKLLPAIVFVLIFTGLNAQDETLKEDIIRLNEGMEQAFENGEMKKLAAYYLDNAVMLSPGNRPVRGREQIDAYWGRTRNPVSWELEVIEVSVNEQDIYENAYYQALENKPPSWRVEGVDTDSDDPTLAYQLGRSTLVTSRDGKENTSVVNFILVWKYTPDGYRILVDTYSW